MADWTNAVSNMVSMRLVYTIIVSVVLLFILVGYPLVTLIFGKTTRAFIT